MTAPCAEQGESCKVLMFDNNGNSFGGAFQPLGAKRYHICTPGVLLTTIRGRSLIHGCTDAMGGRVRKRYRTHMSRRESEDKPSFVSLLASPMIRADEPLTPPRTDVSISARSVPGGWRYNPLRERGIPVLHRAYFANTYSSALLGLHEM